MTVLVAGHLCLDIIPTLDQRTGDPAKLFAPGKLSSIGPLTVATGGAVANTGLALHRLGIPARLMGKVGDDFVGRAILDVIRAYDPRLAETIIIAPDAASSYTLVISPPHVDRSFLYFPGANDTFRAVDVPTMHLTRAQIFHFGYPPTMRYMYIDDGRELASLFWRAKTQGATTSLDMAMVDPASPGIHVDWRALLQEVLPHVDIFMPSLEEIFWMLDREYCERIIGIMGNLGYLTWVDGHLLSELADQLLAMGAAVVGLKVGDRGLYIRTTPDAMRLADMGYHMPGSDSWLARELYTPAFQARIVGTTGAGDCAIAGFLAGLQQGWSLERTTIFAAAVGACNVEQPDAVSGIPRWDEVQRRIELGWPRYPVEMALPGWQPAEALGIWLGPHDGAQNL